MAPLESRDTVSRLGNLNLKKASIKLDLWQYEDLVVQGSGLAVTASCFPCSNRQHT